MTLELSSPNKWAVRAGDTGAEIAKYCLKGILYWDRKSAPSYRWVRLRCAVDPVIIAYIFRTTPSAQTWLWKLSKPLYRWERRK